MSKPKLIIPKMVLTLTAKDSESSPSMPDLVRTVDRGDLRSQQEQISSPDSSKAGSLDSRFRIKSKNNKTTIAPFSFHGRSSSGLVLKKRGTSFSNSDTSLFHKTHENPLKSRSAEMGLKVGETTEFQDSGNSSCNDSEIINVQASDFAKMPSNLRVRCQSLDILDTVSETDNGKVSYTENVQKQAIDNVMSEDNTATHNVEVFETNDDSDRTLCSSTSLNSNTLNEDSVSTLQDVNEGLLDSLQVTSVASGVTQPLQNTSAGRFNLKGILKNKEPQRKGERVTFMAKCDDCDEFVKFMETDELPYGWEKVEDPHYGTYFIDHVNRKTQYENPVLQAKRQAREEKNGGEVNKENDINGNKNSPPAYVPPSQPVFTKNPDQLRGEFIKTQLEKSPRGFGFTILGGNDVDEEFLQIKNVVPGGPAASDAKLRTGDVLVYVNGQCVLGYTHQDVVSIFQTIPIGQKVTLEVCRGYPLPFDPDDPNTEIVTRMAVTLPQDSRVNNSPPEYSRGSQSQARTDINNDGMAMLRSNRPELLTMHIVKGEMGFGFTIADSAYGQKVRQILDRDRCRTLSEGDILVEINEHKVKDMPHSDVVRVLKECVQNSESRIVVQRGGGLLSSSHAKHKNNPASEDRRKGTDPSSVPNSYFNPEDGDGGSLQDEGIDTRFHHYHRLNDSHDSRDHNAPDLVNSSQHRSRTPNADLDRKHSRSPADMLGHEVDSYTRQYGANQRREYNNQDYSMQGYNRNDLSSRSFSQHDRQGQGESTSRYRSRTPGPEFMRSRERDDEQYFGARGRDTARSKTPTSELFKQQSSLSGTPDFIPASRYQSPPRGQPDRRNYNHRLGTNADFMHQNSRIPASQSYGSALSKSYTNQTAPYGNDAMRSSARKQSTSFEYVEPRPSNLTRIPYMERIDSQNEALNRSRSPFDDDRFVEMTVHLQRQESGFGFRIIGGTEEGSQVSVGHIVPGAAADMDGQLRAGDEIIMVDNESVLGASHRKVVQLMGQSAMRGQVRLVIRRRLAHMNDPASHAQSYPYDVTVTRRENEGFGFVIISSVTRAGSVIGRIIENSPATRCGRLHVGDRILAVNNTNIMHMHHEDIVNLIKDSGYAVTLTVGPPQDDSSSTASHGSQRGVASSQGSMINAMAYPAHSESDISRRSDYSPHHIPGTPPHQNTPEKYHQQQILEKHRELARQRTQSSSQASPASVDDDKVYRIELHRGSRGFGFSIRGGREFNNMPLYVLKIAPGGAADLDQRLKVGDEIVDINGYNTMNMTHADAIELIQEHGSTVTLVVKRTGKMPPHLAQGGHMGSQLPVRSQSNTPTLTLPNGPTQGPLSQSSPNPNRRPPETSYYHSNFPRY